MVQIKSIEQCHCHKNISYVTMESNGFSEEFRISSDKVELLVNNCKDYLNRLTLDELENSYLRDGCYLDGMVNLISGFGLTTG